MRMQGGDAQKDAELSTRGGAEKRRREEEMVATTNDAGDADR